MAGAATQIYSHEFDAMLSRVPERVGTLISEKITEMGLRLESYPHYRMSGRGEFRLRVGDYRIIYEFDTAMNEIFLLTLGHRREVYR
jgi:mRNA interferase RelE/StbE